MNVFVISPYLSSFINNASVVLAIPNISSQHQYISVIWYSTLNGDCSVPYYYFTVVTLSSIVMSFKFILKGVNDEWVTPPCMHMRIPRHWVLSCCHTASLQSRCFATHAALLLPFGTDTHVACQPHAICCCHANFPCHTALLLWCYFAQPRGLVHF